MDSNLFEDTLNQINQLKVEAQLLVRAQKVANSVNREIEDLKSEHDKLVKYREVLISILDEESRYLDPCLLPNQIKPEQIQPLMAYQKSLKEAETQLLAHRFTGKSAFKFPEDENLTGYRIESFSEGSFGTPYYLFIGKDANGKPTLNHHTIPPEIDVDSLALEFLSVSVEVFVKEVETKLVEFALKSSQLKR